MCKTEVADSAFADCRRLSDIEYGQWDFSDTEDIYISDVPMRKTRRPFFRIKVILKNEPRLESEIVMEKAKRLYEYIAEHSDLQKEISNILPDDIISNILNGSLPVFPHEDLGIIVDENELIHYMNHAVLYKEVGDGQYIITNSFENLSLRGNIDNNSESSLEEAGKANDNNDLNVQEDNTEAATDIQ